MFWFRWAKLPENQLSSLLPQQERRRQLQYHPSRATRTLLRWQNPWFFSQTPLKGQHYTGHWSHRCMRPRKLRCRQGWKSSTVRTADICLSNLHCWDLRLSCLSYINMNSTLCHRAGPRDRKPSRRLQWNRNRNKGSSLF